MVYDQSCKMISAVHSCNYGSYMEEDAICISKLWKFTYADDICLTKQAEVCRARMLSLIRHGAYGLILPPLAA